MDRWTDEKDPYSAADPWRDPASHQDPDDSHLIFSSHPPDEDDPEYLHDAQPHDGEADLGYPQDGLVSSHPPVEPSSDDFPLSIGGPTGGGSHPPRRSPLSRAERRRRRRNRRLVPMMAVLVIAVLVVVSYVLVGQVKGRFGSPDYSGDGTGSVQIRIANGDGASDIGDTLVSKGVVKSTKAFVNAASKSGQANDIQPGVYRLKLHSSAASAMAAILDPANRLASKVALPEGSTYLQVLQIASTQTKIPLADLKTAVAKIDNLGIPDAFPGVTSAEGFLFPATYEFDPDSTADSVLQTMTAKFTSEFSSLNMVAQAKALKLTPYQVLTIASIAEAEAKFDADRAKVARVIMNRIAENRRLQVDATSAYAAKLEGKDPASVIYATLNTPYNSYTHDGLPPTPIGNPGAAAISGALNPPVGTWLYYVNVDAAGHLGFFTDESQFLAAAATCKAKNWGCG